MECFHQNTSIYRNNISNDEHNKEQRKRADIDRAFRRLFCTHMAQCLLKEDAYQNDTEKAICLILDLLNTDYINRKAECQNERKGSGEEKVEFEYFLSYLKCISRPFLVFRKAIKEAIFDVLLLLLDAVVKHENYLD